MPEYGIKSESFTIISIHSLLVYEKILSASIYRQLCL